MSSAAGAQMTQTTRKEMRMIAMETKKNQSLRAGMPVLAISAALLAAVSPVAPRAAQAQTAAAVTIDCSKTLGTYNRVERYTNVLLSGTSVFSNEVADDDYLHSHSLDPSISRVFINPATIKSSGVNFYDAHLAEVSRYAGSILVAVSANNGSLTTTEYNTYLTQILNHYVATYPKIKYIEAVNEPDLAGLSASLYYNTYYKMFYAAVNTYNTAHSTANLMLGGPVTSNWNPGYIRDFINLYAADTSSSKRLNFLSFHDYVRDRLYDDTPSNPSTYDNDRVHDTNLLADYAHRRTDIDAWLAAAGLPTNLQAWVTENGIFPGPERTSGAYSSLPDASVLTMQAASAATMNYYYIINGVGTGGGNLLPFCWALRNYAGSTMNPEKSLIDPASTNTFTPFGNLMFALSLMPTTRISAYTSSGFDTLNGWGVQTLASSDITNNNYVSALIWNWQQKNPDSYTVTVTVKNLPSGFTGHSVTPHLYLIDTTHSNYVANPATAFLQDVTSTNLTVGANNTYTFTLEPNAVARLKLQPGP